MNRSFLLLYILIILSLLVVIKQFSKGGIPLLLSITGFIGFVVLFIFLKYRKKHKFLYPIMFNLNYLLLKENSLVNFEKNFNNHIQ